MRVKGLGAVNHNLGQLRVQFLEDLFREAGPDVAHSFVAVCCGVVAGEEEGAVDGCAFSTTVVGAENHEVERVAYAGEVVFFDLEVFW